MSNEGTKCSMINGAAVICMIVTGGVCMPAPVRADLASPGFESGPDVAEIRFTPNDADGLRWFVSNTDGERMKSAGSKIAAEGDFYASLLQNSGAYDGTPLGIGYHGNTGFDRIYATSAVTPSTQYTASFQHAADDRFYYLGDTSVVEVVDANANKTITLETFATPGFFDWQMESFSFVTGASTTEIAIAFTVMGSGPTSGVFDDIAIIPEPGTLGLILAGLGCVARRGRVLR